MSSRAKKDGFDLVVAANEPEIETAAAQLRGAGVNVEAVNADLSQTDGVDKLVARIGSRPGGARYYGEVTSGRLRQ